MLYIKSGVANVGVRPPGWPQPEERWIEWHIGDPLPPLSNVVTMQADGQELLVIIDALMGKQATG